MVNLAIDPQAKAVVITFAASRLGYEDLDSWGEQVCEAADYFPGRVIILDLSSVMTLSSVALGKLFKARKKSMATSGEMKIVVTSEAVLEVFAACQINRLFGIYDSLEAALASIA